jgi:hypothetical protein
LTELDFELCSLLPHMGDPGKDVAWRQPQRQPVRVVENDCVAGRSSDAATEVAAAIARVTSDIPTLP